VLPGWFATGVADPQGMKPFVVIASEAKQSRRDGADPGQRLLRRLRLLAMTTFVGVVSF
jgi:hypothetical protein